MEQKKRYILPTLEIGSTSATDTLLASFTGFDSDEKDNEFDMGGEF